MSKAWCEEHKATKPQNFSNKEEMYTARNANGTGPYMLVVARARREDGAQAQPELVGQESKATSTR